MNPGSGKHPIRITCFSGNVKLHCSYGRAIQFSSFSGHFREDRDSEIAPTEERLEHQMRTTGQLNGSVLMGGRLSVVCFGNLSEPGFSGFQDFQD